MNTSAMLDKILERPAMFVGRPSVARIRSFLDGYGIGRHDVDSHVQDELYLGFGPWVASRFKIKTSHGWDDIIIFMGLSESGAFDLLKELWEEYKAQAPTSGVTIP
jgi:hypothetical protein